MSKRVAGLVVLAGCAGLAGACSSSTKTPTVSAGATTTTVPSAGAGSTSSVPTTAPTTAESAAACMVGSWKATNVSITTDGHTLSGGAGATWSITPSGQETIDWTGSANFTESGVTLFRYTGSETETVQVPSSGASTGSWSAQVVTDNRQAIEPVGTEAVPSTAGVTSTGTWTCSGSSLTIDAHAVSSSVDVSLDKT